MEIRNLKFYNFCGKSRVRRLACVLQDAEYIGHDPKRVLRKFRWLPKAVRTEAAHRVGLV
jgi:hypothetical protein